MAGKLAWIEDGKKDTRFHGTLNFYDGEEDFIAKFTNGILVGLKKGKSQDSGSHKPVELDKIGLIKGEGESYFIPFTVSLQIPLNTNFDPKDLEDSIKGLLYAKGLLSYKQAIKLTGKNREKFDQMQANNGFNASKDNAKDDFIDDSKKK